MPINVLFQKRLKPQSIEDPLFQFKYSLPETNPRMVCHLPRGVELIYHLVLLTSLEWHIIVYNFQRDIPISLTDGPQSASRCRWEYCKREPHSFAGSTAAVVRAEMVGLIQNGSQDMRNQWDFNFIKLDFKSVTNYSRLLISQDRHEVDTLATRQHDICRKSEKHTTSIILQCTWSKGNSTPEGII